ncbi:DNA translocase FtsK [Paenisporosarcina macmurdoensis]|uniref:DNA translocase FtsK n=1 Tax=Paenisporosarcina macmurdoensis TaxID=212659 RepID=A0ABW1L636_9BACL
MNWFTKAFKKVFTDEEQEIEEYIDENESPTYKQSKTPFRFPLISDDEKDRLGEEDYLNNPPEEEYRPLYMHKQWQEQRQNTVVHQAAKLSSEYSTRTSVKPSSEYSTRTSTKPSSEYSTRTNAKPSSEYSTGTSVEQLSKPFKRDSYQEVKPRITKIPIQNKVFKPTEVPSPIHGFNRPKVKPIDELLAKKNAEETVAETAVTTLKPIERVPFKATEPVIIAPSEPVIIEQHTIVETKAIQETPVRVEVPIEKNHIVEEVEPVSFVEVEKPTTEKGKKSLPFNVLMLNSDKEKYQQKKVQTITAPSFKQELPVKPVVQPTVVTEKEQSTVVEPVKMDTVTEEQENAAGYIFPKDDYLVPPEQKTQDYEWMQMQADRLIEALSYFQVKADIIQMVQGPAVTQFEMTVGQGTKVSKIRNLADDLKLALAAKDIRIQAPIPGKSSIGIEIPNQTSRPVRLSEVVGSANFKDSDSPLEAALGLDLTGKPVTIDLRKMPHGLIAGATGSGKSVCINSILISLLYKATPKELNLLLIDPKMVELAPFNHIPHLVSPVITDVKAATAALKWAVEEMERRYQLFAHTGVRDITRYNAMAEEKRQFAQKLPYLLIVIDELADLMMMAPTEVEESICRIAQKARACGIHLVVATQRPSVDVITGLIKANIPTRIAFSVSSQIDSRTILDVQGAERLLGRGDMLYQGNGMSAPIRLQGTYVTDEEMDKIIEHARSQGEPSYLFEQEELVRRLEVAEDQDEMFEEACRFILEQGSASTSLLQRKFHMGYNRAARLVDLMEQHGYVSESRGSKAREVFITEDDLQQLFND